MLINIRGLSGRCTCLPITAFLSEPEIGYLMELRACVSMAMIIAGARVAQMEVYQFIWYAMDAGRVRMYPTLSWAADPDASSTQLQGYNQDMRRQS